MKSSEKDLGKTYLEDGLLQKKQKYIKSVFGRIVSETYTKDSYEWYAEWLYELFSYYMKAWKQGIKTVYYVRSLSSEVSKENCVSCSG